jgi:hypothetical protein
VTEDGLGSLQAELVGYGLALAGKAEQKIPERAKTGRIVTTDPVREGGLKKAHQRCTKQRFDF